jgi:hypothetical protein
MTVRVFNPSNSIEVQGQVVHAASGLGVGGLAVALESSGRRSQTLAEAMSNEDGLFALFASPSSLLKAAGGTGRDEPSVILKVRDGDALLGEFRLEFVDEPAGSIQLAVSAGRRPARADLAVLADFLISSRRVRVGQIAGDLRAPAPDSPVQAMPAATRLAILDLLYRGIRKADAGAGEADGPELDADDRIIDPKALGLGRIKFPPIKPSPPPPPSPWEPSLGDIIDLSPFTGLDWVLPDDVSYRDYLRGVAVTFAHQQAVGFYGNLGKWKSIVERQLERRFFQDFRTQDRTPSPLNQQLIGIVRTILISPTGSGFGFAISAASIPAQSQITDRDYLDLLVGLSDVGSEEFANRYRLPLDEADTKLLSPVDLNIHSLKLVLSDTAQGPVEPPDNIIAPPLPGFGRKPIFWDTVVGAAPFFLRYEEWLDSQKQFYPENLFALRTQIQACVRGEPWMDAKTEAYLQYHFTRPLSHAISSYQGCFASTVEVHASAEYLMAFGRADRKLFEFIDAFDRRQYASALRLAEEARQLLWLVRPAPNWAWEPPQTPFGNFPRPMSFAKRRNLAVTDIIGLTGVPNTYPVTGFERFFEVPRLYDLWGDTITFVEARGVVTRLVKYQRAFLLPVLEALCHFHRGDYRQAIDIIASVSGFYIGSASLTTPPGAAKMPNSPDLRSVHQGNALPYTARLTFKDRKHEPPTAFQRQYYVFGVPEPEIKENDLHRLEVRLLHILQAEAMLEWAEQLYRTDGPSEIERARELYKGVFFLHGEDPWTTAYSAELFLQPMWNLPSNPRRKHQLIRASLALQQIKAGLNFYGYRDDAVPTLRFSTLMDASHRWATSAKAEQSDYVAALERMERLDLDLLAARAQKAKAEAATRIAAAQIEVAKAGVIAAGKLVKDVEKQIVAKQEEIDDAESIFGQFRDYLGGMKDSITSFVDVGKGAHDTADYTGLASEAEMGAAVKDLSKGAASGTSVAGGLAVVGLFAAFAALSTATLQGMADASVKRSADLKSLKEEALPVAQATVRAQEFQVIVAQGQASLAAAELAYAADLIRYHAERYLNREFWMALADIAARVMRGQLDFAARSAWFAERALAYQLAQPVNVIRLSYFDRRMRDIGGVDRLILDMTELEAVRLSATRLTLPVKRSYSLARDLPLAFGALKRTGSARFTLSASDLEKVHPGTFAHRIRAVDVAVEAPGAFPVPRGILRNLGLSYINPAGGGRNLPLVRFDDALPVSDFRTRADMTVHDMPGEQLMPFEGSGFTTEWLIELPQDASQPGLARLTDVVITFDIRCGYAGAAGAPVAPAQQSRAVLLSGLALDTPGFAGLRDASSSATLLFRMGELALPGPLAGSKVTNIALLLPGVDSGTIDASLRMQGSGIDFIVLDGVASSNAAHLSDGVAANVQPLNAVHGLEAGGTIEIELKKAGTADLLKQVRDVVLWLEYATV